MLGRKKSALQELVDRGAMTDNVRFTKVYDADIAHETRSNYIETSEKYRFENEYRREQQDFLSRKLKFDEDTAKVIEIFNEYLGSSARSLITEDLNANRFKSAWKRLDNYYNTTEAVDVTGLMSYLTTVIFDPDRDGTLEKFIGKLTHVFTQLATVNNALSEETKLGFIRGALEKGSNRYDSTLTMCKFSRANLTDTLKHLHDFEQERSIKIFAGHSRGEKRKHVLEQMNVSTTSNKNNNNNNNNSNSSNNTGVVKQCYNCGKIGHYKNECPDPISCLMCGKNGHSMNKCYSFPMDSSNNYNNNNNKANNANGNKKATKSKPNKKNNNKNYNIKDAFNKQLRKIAEQNEDHDEEANLIMDCEDDEVDYLNMSEINDLTLKICDNKISNETINASRRSNVESLNNYSLNENKAFNYNAKWIIDSGATSHMSPYINEFINFKNNISHVKLGDNKIITSKGRGDTKYLKNVLYVPQLKYRLISISKLDKDGFKQALKIKW